MPDETAGNDSWVAVLMLPIDWIGRALRAPCTRRAGSGAPARGLDAATVVAEHRRDSRRRVHRAHGRDADALQEEGQPGFPIAVAADLVEQPVILLPVLLQVEAEIAAAGPGACRLRTEGASPGGVRRGHCHRETDESSRTARAPVRRARGAEARRGGRAERSRGRTCSPSRWPAAVARMPRCRVECRRSSSASAGTRRGPCRSRGRATAGRHGCRESAGWRAETRCEAATGRGRAPPRSSTPPQRRRAARRALLRVRRASGPTAKTAFLQSATTAPLPYGRRCREKATCRTGATTRRPAAPRRGPRSRWPAGACRRGPRAAPAAGGSARTPGRLPRPRSVPRNGRLSLVSPFLDSGIEQP